uniref:NADH-ubiquinone oxidoreductase chain 5 n=1 Tax=Dahlica ochrostigma TaxID=2093356 RepID=A0A6H1XJU0_9NEOP|nr:NADH dehydrogenase subunit 5 [Dahlica ochrostigma]QJA15907.1 NADH dehydrogenase subunit 5 [Dahlica ochrostigma]
MYKNMCICYISFFFLFFWGVLFFIFFCYFIMNDMIYFFEWEIITLNSVMLVMSILFDWMSLLFMSFVLLISSVVIYYSKSYMISEINLNRFIILVLFFVFSMLLLIISPNIISILLGWDGLGLISYCLVIYYQNEKSYNAGMLTFLMNRVGDVCIMMVIVWMLNYGSWNYIFYLNFMKNDFFMLYISFLIIMAGMTKSAQIPFSSWLPAAMAAPTPVSSLVHSSTLVTAGVYLLIRFNFFLLETYFLKILLLLSGMTMIMAGISANYEFDLKKIIALSTLSQLGFMMSILSMGFYDLAFFHLLIHAMFKALLFMCAGSFIHMMNDNQDIRFMGMMGNFVPLICLCFIISNMSLCGIPFLSGFYSKDLILEVISLSKLNLMIFFFYYLSVGLTMFYSVRLVFYLMINDFNLVSIFKFFDEDYIMLKGMFFLLFMSLISGSMMNWMIFFYPYFIYLSINLKLMVIYLMLLGMIMGYFVSSMNIYSLNKYLISYNISNFFSMMIYMSSLSVYGFNYYILNFSYKLLKNIDLGWMEYYSGFGMQLILMNYSKYLQLLQINNFKIYLFSFFLLVMICLMFFLMV